MNYFSAWITNIILFLFLAIIVDMLLPNSNMKKYAKFVVGLLLIIIIIHPLMKLFSEDFNVESILREINWEYMTSEKEMEKLIELKKKEIDATQRAYILEQMAVQLQKSVEKELMERFEVTISSIEVIPKSDDSTQLNQWEMISIQLQKANESQAASTIEIVEINTERPLENEVAKTEAMEIQSFLSDYLDVPKDIIHVVVKGGE
ncbi:stage III sporulation protein AF [Aeribacillus pallidus]|uniref:stage III sporulation protein AF n=1 Tax=Aeribacillus pallidus TaxID=33936 RepID=UPI003D1ACF94